MVGDVVDADNCAIATDLLNGLLNDWNIKLPPNVFIKYRNEIKRYFNLYAHGEIGYDDCEYNVKNMCEEIVLKGF